MNSDIVLEPWAGELTAVRYDEETGAHFVIAIHSTHVGPAAGGTRAMVYPDVTAAAADARRLAEAMTLKMAVTGLPMGGGKSVIALPAPRHELAQAMWQRVLDQHAENLRLLRGSYWTGPDVGTTSDDMDALGRGTDFVFGRSAQAGGPGSSAEETAVGVFAAVRAAACEAGFADLRGRRVLIQGLGAVGSRVAEFTLDAGASLAVADVDPQRSAPFAAKGAEQVATDAVTSTECDILVPCATGGLVTSAVAETIPCAVIAGAANNVLGDKHAARVLQRRGVVYAPDFVANAGGAIHLVGREVLGWSEQEVHSRSLEIGRTLETIFKEARAGDLSTEAAARQLGASSLQAS